MEDALKFLNKEIFYVNDDTAHPYPDTEGAGQPWPGSAHPL